MIDLLGDLLTERQTFLLLEALYGYVAIISGIPSLLLPVRLPKPISQAAHTKLLSHLSPIMM